jgi:hypothetical protein
VNGSLVRDPIESTAVETWLGLETERVGGKGRGEEREGNSRDPERSKTRSSAEASMGAR